MADKKDTQDKTEETAVEEPAAEVVDAADVEQTVDDVHETKKSQKESSSKTPTESVVQPEKEQAPEPPQFRVGDTVRVWYRIIEGDKTRSQPFEGIVISKKGSGVSKTFTVRRIGADNVGVERIFPLFSPNLDKVDILKHGKVRRAKLYYLRGKKGRAATRIKERKVKTK